VAGADMVVMAKQLVDDGRMCAMPRRRCQSGESGKAMMAEQLVDDGRMGATTRR
jgi:hypothetical protein